MQTKYQAKEKPKMKMGQAGVLDIKPDLYVRKKRSDSYFISHSNFVEEKKSSGSKIIILNEESFRGVTPSRS